MRRLEDVTPTYPDTRVENIQDVVSGVSFADPFRWLEAETEEVRQWQHSQAELASTQVRKWPHFERLRQWVARFNITPRIVLPRYVAGRWFRIHLADGTGQAQVRVADEPMAEGDVLFDAMNEAAVHPPFVSWISPSPDGRTLAIGVCFDGSERNSIRLIDTATGKHLPDAPSEQLMDNWTGGVHWLPDASGFFFTAIAGAAADFRQTVYLHRRTPAPTTAPITVAWSAAQDWRMVVVSRDGRYAVALERLTRPIPVAIAALDGETLQWRAFVTNIPGTLAGHVVGDRYIAVTDVGAPRGRLIAIALNADDPNDVDAWEELVPESDATLRTVTPVGEVLYLTEIVDTYSRLRIVDGRGQPLGQVPLPALGTVGELPFPFMNLAARGHPGQFLFAFSTLTHAWSIHRHTPGEVGIEELKSPEVSIGNAVIEDHWAVSADGTRIPYHLVRRVDVSTQTPQPTLIYGYGGFNVPLMPQFPGPMAAVVAVGGVYVHAHLRGGAEFGQDWWHGGRMTHKQNGYNDLYAIAEDLIAKGRCTPRLLAVSGGSNGGLMAGVALTQRPELWQVVVPRVPMLDLIGACREAYGRMCIEMEYARLDEPDEVRRLASFSPYHLLRDGVHYPAVFMDAGGTDPRCPPWHARKFAARLQRATASGAPILLHVWDNVGHGWATKQDVAVEEHTEWLAFTLQHLGVTWTTEDACLPGQA